jgi:type IV pilus assembly protein PilO
MMELFKGSITPRDWAATGGLVGFTVLLCAAFIFVLYNPLQARLAATAAMDAQIQADLRVANRAEANIEALRAEAAKMQELVTQFQERLPESREIPTLLKQFEGFAGEIGLRVELSQMLRLTDARKETIPYSVVARGNFHQIVGFINRLERFQRYLKVSDLNIGKEEDGVAEATFTLSTYRFIEPSETASTQPASEAKKS